jgi:hypothetical protein
VAHLENRGAIASITLSREGRKGAEGDHEWENIVRMRMRAVKCEKNTTPDLEMERNLAV